MTAVALAGSVAVSSPASAASYNGVCGSGYSVVNSASIGNLGTMFLTYNSSNGYNCAVAIRNVRATRAWWMEITLNTRSDGTGEVSDLGVYSTYAGPVYKYGKGECMWWTSFIWTWEGQDAGASKSKTNCG